MSKKIFEPVEIYREGAAPLVLRNRTMRSATWESLGDPVDGRMTEKLASLYETYAQNKVGLLTFSYISIRRTSRSLPGQLIMDSDEIADTYVDVIRRVHAAGALCMAQLNHGGRFVEDALPAVGPSGNDIPGTRACREMTLEEIDQLKKDFVAAAVRAKRCGFDIVQLHCAHTYLLSQFLSPIFNKRTDKYGGSLENRARVIREIVKDIRAAVGPEYPLAAKMNVSDFAEGGYTIEESAQVAQWLADDGLVLLEASGGSSVGKYSASRAKNNGGEEGYHAEGAAAWKAAVQGHGHALVALVGGVRAQKSAEKFVNDGVCDIVSMARPFLREPDIVKHWEEDPDYVAKCASCGSCFKAMQKTKDFVCIFNMPK